MTGSNEIQLIHPREVYTVLSASRMTDMPAFYPNELIEGVKSRIHKGVKISTLVLWTKHPQKLFDEPLHTFLVELKKSGIQLFVQLTISGMGGIICGKTNTGKPLQLEPNVSSPAESLALLPKIIELIENPARIRLRIDPIVRIEFPDKKIYTNLPAFEPILKQAAKLGINNFTFSFLEKRMHRKVDNRFERLGINILSPNHEERAKMLIWTRKLAQQYEVSINACCVPELPSSSCINGLLLEQLHDQHLPVSHKMPKSRTLCGCTASIDIGGWPPRKCRSGCLYCYANPSTL